ncbi:MAG: lytic transglycosylase domain-containing protein, partial [Paracoccaceae bacterium]
MKIRGFLIAAVILPVLGGGAVADPLSLSTRGGAFQGVDRLQVLDQRANSQFNRPVSLAQPRAIIPGSPEAIALAGNYNGVFLEPARAAAASNGVPEMLFLRLIKQESNWSSVAVSSKGAIGLAQLMPATARRLGVDPRDPLQNLNGGARYLRQMYDQFGNWRLALAAYNGGPEAVLKYRGVPPFAETQNYVL